MRKVFLLWVLCALPLVPLKAGTANHTFYLLQSKEYKKGIAQYQAQIKEQGKHDYTMLEQIGHIILSHGASSDDETVQLLSMYGASISGSKDMMSLFEKGMKSKNPVTQLVTINFLRQNYNDKAVDLLLKAFNSPYPVVRMQAAGALCEKKAHKATGIIYNLMERFHPAYHGYFAQLFAMMGCQESLAILKKMINHKVSGVRIAAILAAARFGRDDFSSVIKKGLTHANMLEKEACVYALGHFQDFSSLATLVKLACETNTNLALCSAQALMHLGEEKGDARIVLEAMNKNPFAVFMLAQVESSDKLLISLLSDYHYTTRVNAALALLEKRNHACTDMLIDILSEKNSGIGFMPIYSEAGALFAWKEVPSCFELSKKIRQNLPLVTRQFKERILIDALELPSDDFLKIAKSVLASDDNKLIPTVVRLLESMHTDEATKLLVKESNKIGCPFNRTYAHLALYRMRVNTDYHRAKLIQWASKQKNHKIIEFKEMENLEQPSWSENAYKLSPEERSQLLIETFDALASAHDKQGIDLLISLIKEGHEKNRYLLAGLLMKCIL